jgi:hypothetical protein
MDHNSIDYIADRWFGFSGHSQGFRGNKNIYYFSRKFRLQWPYYVGYIIGWDEGIWWKIYYKKEK